MKSKILFTVIILISMGSSVFAQTATVVTNNKPGWHKMAETAVDLRKDRDEVLVLGKDHFKSMRLRVTDAPVEILDLTVVYENDTRQDIPVRHLIKPGGKTREINLEGRDRAIKKVILTYKTVPTGQMDKAHVEIWGKK